MSAASSPSFSPSLISLDALRRAAEGLRGVAVRTPLLPLVELGADVWVKPEMLQRGGAFKFRGAYTFLSQLDPSVRARGVIAPSSGNHAQAVALAARMFGVPATVVMPTTVTPAKRGGAERLGARVVLAGTTTHHRWERAVEIAREEGGTVVPPYDDPTIIAGQGTAGLEIVEDLPAVRTVLVPVGGGGLSAGVAAAVKLVAPNARVVAVEPEGSPKLSRAWAAGEPVEIPSSPDGLADGLLAVRIGAVPFAHHRAYLDDVVTVPDAALRGAMRMLLDRMKLVVEPSGAITVAALMQGLVEANGATVAVLSGGNIEWDGLRALLGDGRAPGATD
ncbi:MAG TPA: threonine/serine dehydratase [Gemmatimonadaceae bacterium]|nr:threonine/serine dehydratase [Gemmatimonadaceae bacterium]